MGTDEEALTKYAVPGPDLINMCTVATRNAGAGAVGSDALTPKPLGSQVGVSKK